MRCAIWYHLHNLENVKSTHGGVLILVKLQAKINTPPWVFFTFFKLNKWCQIAKRITYVSYKISKFQSINIAVTLTASPFPVVQLQRFPALHLHTSA